MTSSAVYQGWITHRRSGPVPHSFGYPIFLPLFDLEELPDLLDGIPLWSARRPAPVRFRESDFLPGEGGTLPERARNLAEARLGRRPDGPLRLLANPRYLGVGFNPVSFLFLYDGDGASVDSVIAEVTNTPWGERTAYVIDGREGQTASLTGRFEKQMHVSPFQPMGQMYEISVGAPDERLGVIIRNLQEGREVLAATMALKRRELTRALMLRLLVRYPPATIATLTRIYMNALRLKARGAPHHPLPAGRQAPSRRATIPPITPR